MCLSWNLRSSEATTMAALVFRMSQKKLSAAQWPAADWLLLYSSILITGRQKKNLEKPPIKWKPEFQAMRVKLSAAVIWFSLFSSVSAHKSSWRLHGSLCAAMLAFTWAAISRRWVTINIIPRGEEGKKDKVKKATLSYPAHSQWCGYCIQVEFALFFYV